METIIFSQLVLPYANSGIKTESLRIEVRIESYHPMEQTFRGPIEPFAEGCELNANIAGLSLSNSLTDVSLVGSNGEALSAHKVILCARSPVFQAMFSNGMKESLSEVVTIPDIDTAVLRDMLVYVYTDRCPQETLEMHAEPLLGCGLQVPAERIGVDMRRVSEHRYHCGKRGEDFSPFRCAPFRAVEVVLGEVPERSTPCSLVGVSSRTCRAG